MSSLPDFRFKSPGLRWRALTKAQHAQVATYLGDVDDRFEIKDTTKAWSTKLSFYKEARLLALYDEAWDADQLIIYYVVPRNLDADNVAGFIRLTGRSGPIYEANAAYDIGLNPSVVSDYLRFFCFFVHGSVGPFYVLDSQHDTGAVPSAVWSGPLEDQSPDKRPFSTFMRDPVYLGQNEAGGFKISAFTQYDDALFIADFVVKPGGLIEMAEDEPVMINLGYRISRPLEA